MRCPKNLAARREATNGSGAKEVTGSPSLREPPRPNNEGKGGTLREAVPPCIRAKSVRPMVVGVEGSEKVPRRASRA
jgi:hypothetical protein